MPGLLEIPVKHTKYGCPKVPVNISVISESFLRQKKYRPSETACIWVLKTSSDTVMSWKPANVRCADQLALYRAKSIDSGEWGVGYIAKQYGSWFLVEASNSDTDSTNSYPVDPETICQCTGFSYTKFEKDEDGMERGFQDWIWENDIVQIGDWLQGVVKFGLYGAGGYGFYIHFLNTEFGLKDFGYWITQKNYKIKVIGNVYDTVLLRNDQSE